MVAEQQMEEIRECGAIYVNRAGGYHGYYKKAKEYAVVKSDKLIFPDYRKNDIKITKFPYGNHYYAKVGSTEVRDGDVIKWNTYEEAYRQAEKYLCSEEHTRINIVYSILKRRFHIREDVLI